MVLPSLVLVLAVAVGAVTAADARLACSDAARVGARALARGEHGEHARALALDTAPPGAVVRLSRKGGAAHVTVTARVAGLEVGGSAAVLLEPGVSPPPPEDVP